jgi:GH43 family beta-xylosidase
VRQDSVYYLVQSDGKAIWVYRSTRLTEVASSTPVKVWTAPDTAWNRSNVWAPELHFFDGHWYIYYAAGVSGPPYLYQRAGVLQSVGTDPQGAYVDKGMLYTGDDVVSGSNTVWAIDLTVERLNGQLYAVWSGWKTNNVTTDRTPQHLYIATMSDPWTISSNRVELSSPTATWELGTELDLQEGPEFLEHAGAVFIIYSTRESWLPDYKLGQLRLTGTDPLSPASWVKSGPVFTGTGSVYGVGHASFTTSPDGSEDWIVYHSKRDPSPGWDRVIRMQKFGWKADGSPDFGTPVPPGQSLPMPSGQCR